MHFATCQDLPPTNAFAYVITVTFAQGASWPAISELTSKDSLPCTSRTASVPK